MAFKIGIQIYQILTNDDEVCTPSLSSIVSAVLGTCCLFIRFHKICEMTVSIEGTAKFDDFFLKPTAL